MRQLESQRKQRRRELLAEGAGVRQQIQQEKARLERIKDDKLSRLIQSGVPSKYTYNLVNKKLLAVMRMHRMRMRQSSGTEQTRKARAN